MPELGYEFGDEYIGVLILIIVPLPSSSYSSYRRIENLPLSRHLNDTSVWYVYMFYFATSI